MKVIRFRTPNGNVWLARDKDRYGIGKTKKLAQEKCVLIDDKEKLVINHIVGHYSRTFKMPMLIVASNNFQKGELPSFALDQYDFYLFFYPNSSPFWVCGALALSRMHPGRAPLWAFSANADSKQAMKNSLHHLLAKMPHDFDDEYEYSLMHPKKILWLINWMYRCQKIALRDVLALEPYTNKDTSQFIPENTECFDPNPIRKVIGGIR
jgi:hypothetical protein